MESTKASQGLGQTLYRAAKYLIYGLLTLNIGLFLQEELLSAQHALSDGQNLASLIQLFSATLDTAAWVVLLLLFE
ncbi:MAG: shikimate kinase, partial [Proteobacteria bacterium]|nr:shikimate kinase [Pseudomonadota bacterium]